MQPPPLPASMPPQYHPQQSQHYGAFQGPGVQQPSPFEVSPFEASSVPPMADPYGPSSHHGPPQPQAGAGQYALAIIAGVLVAILIGGAGFLVWRGKHAPQPEASAPAVTSTTAAGQGGQGAPSLPKPATPASTEITFRLAPADATLSVDGKDLPPSTRAVPRPAVGMTVNVVVRAKGCEDVTVLVDFFTTSPMELTLKPAPDANVAPAAATATAVPAAEEPVAAAPPKDPVPVKDPVKKPPRPPKDPSVPANPY